MMPMRRTVALWVETRAACQTCDTLAAPCIQNALPCSTIGALDERGGHGALDETGGLGALDERGGLGALDERGGLGALDERGGHGALDERGHGVPGALGPGVAADVDARRQ
eukprot:365814-Chlamydomonas_euryale.AAC.3